MKPGYFKLLSALTLTLTLCACNGGDSKEKDSNSPVNPIGSNPSTVSSGAPNTTPEGGETPGSKYEPEVFRMHSNWEKLAVNALREVYQEEFKGNFTGAKELLTMPCVLSAFFLYEEEDPDSNSLLACFESFRMISTEVTRLRETNEAQEEANLPNVNHSSEDQITLTNTRDRLLAVARKMKGRDAVQFLSKSAMMVDYYKNRTVSVRVYKQNLKDMLDLARKLTDSAADQIFDQFYNDDASIQKYMRQVQFTRVNRQLIHTFNFSQKILAPSASIKHYRFSNALSSKQILSLEKIRRELLQKEAQPNYLENLIVDLGIEARNIEIGIFNLLDSQVLDAREVVKIKERSKVKNLHDWLVRTQTEQELIVASTISLLQMRSPEKARKLKTLVENGVKVHNLIVDIIRNPLDSSSLIGAAFSILSEVAGMDLDSNSEISLVREQLAVIHENLETIHTEMHGRFDRVDHNLGEILSEVKAMRLETKEDLAKVSRQLFSIQNSMNAQYRSIYDAIRNAQVSEYSQMENACLGPHSSIFARNDRSSVRPALRMDRDRDAVCLSSFFDRAVRFSLSAKVNEFHGESSDEKSSRRNPWYRLEGIYCRAGDNCENFVNPQEWAMGANAYADYISKAGLYNENLRIELQQMQSKGEEILAQWNFINSAVAKESILDRYFEKSAEIAQYIEEKTKEFEVHHAGGTNLAELRNGQFQNYFAGRSPADAAKDLGRIHFEDYDENLISFGSGYVNYEEHPHLIRRNATIKIARVRTAYWIADDGSKLTMGRYQYWAFAAPYPINTSLCNGNNPAMPPNQMDCLVNVVRMQMENFRRLYANTMQAEAIDISETQSNILLQLQALLEPKHEELSNYLLAELNEPEAVEQVNDWFLSVRDLQQYINFHFLEGFSFQPQSANLSMMNALRTAQDEEKAKVSLVSILSSPTAEEAKIMKTEFSSWFIEAPTKPLSSVVNLVERLRWLNGISH